MATGHTRLRNVITKVDAEVQTEVLNPVEGLEMGECDPFPVQSEGNEPRVDDVAEGRLLELYHQLYQEQRAENQATASAGSGMSQVELRPLLGVIDGSGSHEVWFSERGDGFDGVQEPGSFFVQGPLRRPPDQMLAEARAPTVPQPPPLLGHIVERIRYADDEVVLELQPVAVGEDENSSLPSSSEEHSSIGQWTTDSAMPRGHSSGSDGTGHSARSLAAVSLAASVHSARGYQELEKGGDGSWELGVLLTLVAAVCGLTGVLCACAWLKCRSNQGISDKASGDDAAPRTPRTARGSQGAELSPPRHKTPEGPNRCSPVVNITVHSHISGFTEESRNAVEADEEGGLQDSRSEIPVGLPKGLGQGNPKRSSEVLEEGPEDYHSGLGLSRTLREEESLESGGGQNQQSATASCSAAEVPVGPPRVLGQDRKPLGPAENSNPVEPCGLGPVGTLKT